MAPLERLSPADLTNLAVEGPDSPMHQAALGVLEGGAVGADGRVHIEAIRAHIASRLDRVPELRRVLRQTHMLEGRPLWVDDPTFDVAHHVHAVALPAPGGEAAALAFAAERMAELMDRSRPLWQMWFLEAYGPGQAGILIKLHHALADGTAMINLVAQLFDLSPDTEDEPAPPWTPITPPSRRRLVRENFGRKRSALARAGRRFRHPAALARRTAAAVSGALTSVRRGRGAPHTSLNTPIGSERRIAVVRLPLGEVRAVAHACGAKVNDVFLSVVAGAFREVLLTRGEAIEGRYLRATMAVSLHPAGDGATAGNLAGTVVVRLPLDALDPATLVARVSRDAAEARTAQHPFNPVGLMLLLARAGLTRRYIRRQRLVNVLTTNLPGPPVSLYFAGARLIDAVAMPPIAGNVTVSVAALSYAGNVNLSAVADASAWPDLDVLVAGMRSSWADLRKTLSKGPAQEGRTALSA